MKEGKNIGEEELAILCSKGDRSAMRELYTRYAAMVTMLCSRFSKNSAEATDLMHDTMLKVFKSIGNFNYRGEGSLSAWIRALAVNTAIDRNRKAASSIAVSFQNYQEEEGDIEPEDARNVPLSVLKNMISELPTAKRMVFCMHCIEGYSHKQIADHLGITENASSSMLSKAKGILAEKVRKYLKEKSL